MATSLAAKLLAFVHCLAPTEHDSALLRPGPTIWRAQDSPRTHAPSVHHRHSDTAPTVSGPAHPEATRPSAESAEPNPGSTNLPRLRVRTRCSRRTPARSTIGIPAQSPRLISPDTGRMRQCSRQTRSPSAPLEPSSDRHLPSVAARIYALVPTTAGICTGTPSAARIISLVHPAQQMYFCGSSTEIARLSLLLSCPAAAQDGHPAIQFRP